MFYFHPFFKITDPCVDNHFQCVHTTRFSEPTKVESLETNRVNGPLNHSMKDSIKKGRLETFPVILCGPDFAVL